MGVLILGARVDLGPCTAPTPGLGPEPIITFNTLTSRFIYVHVVSAVIVIVVVTVVVVE